MVGFFVFNNTFVQKKVKNILLSLPKSIIFFNFTH